MRGYGVGGHRSAQASARPNLPVRATQPEPQPGRVKQLLQRLSRADLLRSGLAAGALCALLVGALALSCRRGVPLQAAAYLVVYFCACRTAFHSFVAAEASRC